MKILKPNLQIAIDGPVAAGKSNVAQRLSKELGILYVYTGAMYRAVGWLGRKHNLDLTKSEAELVKIVDKNPIILLPSHENGYICHVQINGEDITKQLFTHQASKDSSEVATLPGVRHLLVRAQKKIAENQPVVMEGRDITSVVLPSADLKVYMDADIEVRSKRRQKDLIKQGYNLTLEKVIQDTKDRDYQDTHRSITPLEIVQDAWVIDTTNLSMDEVIQAICTKLVSLKLIENE